MPRRWLISGSLVTVAIVVLISSYAISAYHMQVGGRALSQALGEIDLVAWWYVGPRTGYCIEEAR